MPRENGGPWAGGLSIDFGFLATTFSGYRMAIVIYAPAFSKRDLVTREKRAAVDMLQR